MSDATSLGEAMRVKKKKVIDASKKSEKGRVAHEAEGAASGALAGAALGAAAGPPGMIAGAVIGGIAGAAAGAALDTASSREEARTRELDAEIGVTEGDLGAPNLKHPPAKVGAYSGASSGAAASSGEEAAEGPMQTPED
jgi:phage tail tape-measure protein